MPLGELDAARGTLHVANAVWRRDVAGAVRRARVRRLRDRKGRRRRPEDPRDDALGESSEAARRSRLVSGPQRDDCHRRRREDPRLHQRIQHHRGDSDRQPRDRRRGMVPDRRPPIPVAELLPRDRGRRNRRDDRGMGGFEFRRFGTTLRRRHPKSRPRGGPCDGLLIYSTTMSSTAGLAATLRPSGVIWYRNVAGRVLDLRNVFGPALYWTRRSSRTRLSSSSMTSSGLTSRMFANSSLFVIPLPSRRAANTRMRWRRSFRTFRFFSPASIASTA